MLTAFYRTGPAALGVPACWSLLLALLLLPAPPAAWGDQTSAQEYRVKAALIPKLTRFVSWPDAAFEGTDSPLQVCVLGDDPFGSSLDALAGVAAGKRSIAVSRPGSLADAVGRCHVLFVAASERVRLRDVLKALEAQPIFTLSDIEGFARRGGILQMYTAATRIRFAINRDSAQRAGLRIAAPLLDLAELVED